MAHSSPLPSPERDGAPSGAAGCLLRLTWHIGGASALVILLVTILRSERWTLGAKDVLYALVVLAMIVCRYVDVARFGGQTTLGEPATLRDVRRYAWMLVLGAGLAWTGAQSLDA